MRRAHEKLEAEIQEFRRVFLELDDDGNGTLTRDEFLDGLGKTEVQASLFQLDIRLTDAESLFDILDQDESGEMSIMEFVEGCLRARGGPKARDVMELECKFHKLKKDVHKLRQEMRDGFQELGEMVTAVKGLRQAKLEDARSDSKSEEMLPDMFILMEQEPPSPTSRADGTKIGVSPTWLRIAPTPHGSPKVKSSGSPKVKDPRKYSSDP